MKPLDQCFLYAFVDLHYLAGRSAQVVTRQLCEGGADLIQLRAKGVPAGEIHRLAQDLLPITEATGVGLVINDHPAIALEIGAPVCHLGQEDFFHSGCASRTDVLPAGSNLKLGLSSHAPLEAHRAVAAGADYVAIGPVYPTATKPGAKAVTLEYVRWAATNLTCPWFAIGGINFENIDAVLAAGGRRVCIVSAILNAPDIVLACQRFKKHITSASTL